MVNVGHGYPTLIHVVFSGNAAGGDGGGLYVTMPGMVSLTNVTFSGNSAGSAGGALFYEMDASAIVVNSIMWGNTPDQIRKTWPGQVTVSYSDVEGGWPGESNIDVDPAFYDAEGPDGVPGTLDDDLRLRYFSPVIDKGDNGALPLDGGDLDGDGVVAEPLPLDLSGRSRLIGFTVVDPVVDMGAYEASILDVIAEATALWEEGASFRMEHVQLLPADTMAQALQNYKDFNDGELFYDFCADYDQIDDAGYCPEDVDRLNVRNTLFDAIELFSVAQGWPTDEWTSHTGQVFGVRQIGGSGVVAASHEIVNVHLIFGNEFLVDAIDYRFSLEGIPYAEEIINKELEELGEAKRQFELAMDLLFLVFGEYECGAGQYCTTEDFETFGVASSRMMVSLDEMAARYRMLGDDQAALDIYDRAYEEQYMQLTTLTQMARRIGAQHLQNGSWEMFNNLSRMRDRAQAIRDGLDFFGFAPDYVPLQSYEALMVLTEGPVGDTGLLSTARDLEDQAREAQRTYDTNASSLSTELAKLMVEYNGKLRGLCGTSEDADGDGLPDYNPCEGGLMGRNFYDLDAASLRVGLAWLKAQSFVERIQIEQERAATVIEVDLGLAQSVSAVDLAIGKLNAYKETYSQLGAAEHKITAGIKASAEVYAQTEVKGSINPLASGAEIKSGLKVTLGTYVGYEASGRWVSSADMKWDPNAEKIGNWQSVKTLQAAEARSQILGANSSATIKNLLLQQSQALIEYEIAMVAYNKLAAEHNQLAADVARTLNKRTQAANKVAKYNSHLLSPAYRILRDTLTIQSAEAHSLAAQFAYLTARAAEYELLTPYPDLDAIYRARTSNDIRLFLDRLNVWYQAINLPGQLNRYPYTISFAEDVVGLTDEYIDPDGRLSPEDVDQIRFEQFQAYLQDQPYNDGRLELWFSTSLGQQQTEGQFLFSPNIWNNRIAGIGAPLAQNEGVSLNIVTRQTGDVGNPEAVLIHDGQTSYRNASEEIVYYDPDTAVPVGYLLPDELDPENTSIVLRPGINGVGGLANSGLINRSVAASSWTFRIPANSKGYLDYSQIEDIEITIDTTGRALPNMMAQATSDAVNLQAGLALDPVTADRFGMTAVEANPVTPASVSVLPANPDGIGGSYFGSVIVTSPMTVAVQVLDFDLVNEGGVLSGTINTSEAALYDGDVQLHGVAVGDAFTVTSDVITNVVLSRSVQRTITLVGTVLNDGEILKATYTAVITDLLCTPVTEVGMFSASRPGSPGSDDLKVEARLRSLPLQGSTTVTVTLRDSTMELVSAATPITLTSDLGVMTPVALDVTAGIAVATFTAGDTIGRATIYATTGDITDTVQIQIEGIRRVYLPLVFSSSGEVRSAPDLVVDTITATSDMVQVAITNAGDAPVVDGFWVDAYIDPATVPSETNQIWNDLSAEGLVWGVKTALAPGETIVLSVDDAYYWPQISHITWSLLAGTPVYVQVDSWNPDTSYGAVRESHEIAGEPYVNNIGFTRVRRDDIGVTENPSVDIEREVLPGELPLRSELEGPGR
ncbi:MAG: Ig-like domain-containing protein [Anaerolineae bacterium]|nr:Ig-like domain-containing protein [Anaerolineae bacterium]